MRLEAAYLDKPLVSPVLEISMTGSNLPVEEESEKPDDELSFQESIVTPDQDLLDLAPSLRLEQLERKLKLHGAGHDDSHDVIESASCSSPPSSYPGSSPNLSAGSLSTSTESNASTGRNPADEVKDLENKLRFDLQNLYIAPLVRTQKNKQDLRYNHADDFTEYLSSISENSATIGHHNRFPTTDTILQDNLKTDGCVPSDRIIREEPNFHCCDDIKSKYDRKNLYLLLSDVSECAKSKKTQL